MGRTDLVLRADAVAAAVALDMDGLGGELHGCAGLVAQGMEGVEQADGEGGTGAQSGHLGEIAVMMDFNAIPDVEVQETLPDSRMLDILGAHHIFNDGIDDACFVLEEGGEPAAGQIAIAGDAGGEHTAAVLVEPGGIVRATSEKGDAVGGAGNNHDRACPVQNGMEKRFICES